MSASPSDERHLIPVGGDDQPVRRCRNCGEFLDLTGETPRTLAS